MLDNQLNNLVAIIKSEDMRKYAGNGIWDLINAVVFSDPIAAGKALKSAKDLIFHLSTLLFWDKMSRFLGGTFHGYEDQVKMAAKFNPDNEDYKRFVKKLIQTLDQLDDDDKVDYFAALTRAFLLTKLERGLFFKLSKYIEMCTTDELEFIKNLPYEDGYNNSAMISVLYQYGLFTERTLAQRSRNFVLSDFGKALKQNCLNFDESLTTKRITAFSEVSPLNIWEMASKEDVDEMLSDVFDKRN